MKNIRDIFPQNQNFDLLLQDDDQGPDNSVCGNRLEEATLNYFKAEPASIQPFRATEISWSVGRAGALKITLNGQHVEHTGSMIVSPQTSTNFTLRAVCGNASTNLGTIRVDVDLDACIIDQGRAFCDTIWALILGIGSRDSRFEFRGNRDEQVQLQIINGRVNFHIRMEAITSASEKPQIDIRGEFGLTVLRDQGFEDRYTMHGFLANLDIDLWYSTCQWIDLYARGEWLSATVLLNRLQTTTHEFVHDLFDRIVEHRAVKGIPPIGHQIQNVRIHEGDNGLGIINRTFCSYFPRPTHDGGSSGPVKEQ